MTQEELDALMAGGDLDAMDEMSEQSQEVSIPSEADEVALEEMSGEVTFEEEKTVPKEVHEYRASATMSWPPPPPTDDHKMVHQLDDVTKDSEIKASQVFDKLDNVNNFMMDAERNAKEVIKLINTNTALFETLVSKFPNIQQFQNALDDNKAMKERVEEMLNNAQMAEDEIMMAMDIMQYQDIHRQKIERVINVMRALSKYMNALFEGKKDDEKRVGSAVHNHGDDTTEDVVSSEEIEALIASLGKK